MEERQRKRAQTAADRSIGLPMSVRTDRRTTVQGTISACRIVESLTPAPGEKPQFEITMLCGSARVERTFVVNKLPQPERAAAED